MTCDLLGDVSDEPVSITRPEEHINCEYSNLAAKYTEKNVDFNKQYYKLYSVRLEKMLPFIKERIKQKWGSKFPIIKLHKISEQPNKKFIIVGTLYKEQKLKPSLLKKISEANCLVPQPIYTHFTDDSDQLFIEDDLQRYQIIGDIDVHKFVTGITCAFLGQDQGMGKFSIEDYCFANCRRQIERPIKLEDDKFVCFISGMNLVNYGDVIGALKLFMDWMAGFLGDVDAHNDTKKICRLIVAGDSIRTEPEFKKQTSLVAKVVETSETFTAVQQFDVILSQLVRFLNVDVMPGRFDPSNHLLAQQPMHHCMFPKASKYKNLNCVTNPYECKIEGLKILGTSGQPISDITAYSTIESSIEALEQCLVWNHLAPTCPDTLGSYPYYSKDPFVLEECPNVFFAGNQPEFSTKLFKGPEGQQVRLICIPKFSKTLSVVLLNLKNMECYDMAFTLEAL